jgi:hypothetical protein
MFVTASRYATGLESRHETVIPCARGALGELRLLAASFRGDDLLAFRVEAGGALGQPVRLDLRDCLYLDMPTHIETVEVGEQSFAILSSAVSSSVSVVTISANGQMWVTHQIIGTIEMRFTSLAGLEVL